MLTRGAAAVRRLEEDRLRVLLLTAQKDVVRQVDAALAEALAARPRDYVLESLDQVGSLFMRVAELQPHVIMVDAAGDYNLAILMGQLEVQAPGTPLFRLVREDNAASVRAAGMRMVLTMPLQPELLKQVIDQVAPDASALSGIPADATERSRLAKRLLVVLLVIAAVALSAIIGLGAPRLRGYRNAGPEAALVTPTPSGPVVTHPAIAPVVTGTLTETTLPVPSTITVAPTQARAATIPSGSLVATLTVTPSTALTATAALTTTSARVAVGAPALLQPPPNHVASGVVWFSWQSAGPLPAGAAYEVVWWNTNENPATARGMAAPTSDSSLSINLDVLFGATPPSAPEFYWTVLVVQTSPYVRLTQPDAARARLLTYPRFGGGGTTTPPAGK